MRHFLSTRVVLALALLAAQFGSLAHVALIEHEDTLDTGACTAAAHGIDEATEGARFEAPVQQVSLHTADGCAVLAHSRILVRASEISVVVPRLTAAPQSWVVAEHAPPPALSPLTVAPKSSPPARG